jgi:hypothetical protein
MVYWLIGRMDKRTTYMFHRKGAKARGKIIYKNTLRPGGKACPARTLTKRRKK